MRLLGSIVSSMTFNNNRQGPSTPFIHAIERCVVPSIWMFIFVAYPDALNFVRYLNQASLLTTAHVHHYIHLYLTKTQINFTAVE
ncbi:hypothetical protein OUZ56_001280 [Daphnia magna]|uniref:Uncharacterized protein n=1 Tax=Daphnia magna TaxID=35525 RepID=A0ABR0A2R5_9CRUS|nr:hypothetical protein OUZ56_001280 [Daphnia magna]